MKVALHAGRCEGFGFCAELAPRAFQLDEEGDVQILLADIPDELEEDVLAAIRACPMAALSRSG